MKRFYKFSIVVTIFLFAKESTACAQQVIVEGVVQGVDGPLNAATISIDKTITQTNKQGIFSLQIPTGIYVLQITHSGYEKIVEEIKVADTPISLRFLMEPMQEMEGITVVGSRFATQRNSLTNTVPIDVISSRQLLQTGQTSLTQMLQFTVPSFNASRQTVNEPITLRGLDPDQVLILVNGKRYHNMSFLNWGGVRGILGRGAVSNDLNAIPFSAIEKIEVLRDGASAQYGSDAIAGVINIQLKNSTNKTWAQIHAGQFYNSDGETVGFGINRGIQFLKKGFLNFSSAFRYQNPTYRGGKFTGLVYKNDPIADEAMVKERNFNRSTVSNAGASKHTGFSFSANGGYSLNAKTELFWTGILNERKTIFTSGYVFPILINRVNPELFPDGFKPQPTNQTTDISAIIGIKGKTEKLWDWELSSSYGKNRGKYFNAQTNNASQFSTLGKNAPTSFYTGSLIYGQLTNNFQITKKISNDQRKLLNLAAGLEWRLEHYQIKGGEEASWHDYDFTGPKQGGSGGLVLHPKDAVVVNRNVRAAYIELESELSNRFLVNAAGRYEYYNDFGSNLAGKIAARYNISDKFFLRTSVSNGFRAPSLQQTYYSHTRETPESVGGTSVLVTKGVFRNDSEVAKKLGIPSLEAERSVNLSAGFSGLINENIQFALDGYWITVRDRIVLSSVFSRRNNYINDLLRDLTNVNELQFFANAINTNTRGVDLRVNGKWKIRTATLISFFAANFTNTKLFGDIKKAGKLRADSVTNSSLFSIEEKTRLEKGQPSNKIIWSLTYQVKKASFHIQNTRFGKTAIAPSSTDQTTNITSFLYESFSPKILTDISTAYSLKQWMTLTIGVNNIFNVYPDRIKDERNTSNGMHIYSMDASPFGFNGGYYFVSAEIKF